jgi:hypothetical protein
MFTECSLNVQGPVEVVVKKATDFGVEEAWMNERVRRACPEACAEFLDAFEDSATKGRPLWLIWTYEVQSGNIQCIFREHSVHIQ